MLLPARAAAIFGFVVGADTVLLNHESQQRTSENRIRQLARIELGRQGIVASEAEIERWKESLKQEYLAKQATAASPSSPPTSAQSA